MSFSERYSRQINLTKFGTEAQQKLQQASVLVVGAGGLGVPVLQYLVAMGVGFVGIVDGDVISLANLNRQVLYNEFEVGQQKVAVASARLLQQNPSAHVRTYPVFLTVENAVQIVQSYDLVIDATDNFSARYLINDTCVLLGKPFVYGAIQQYEGHLSVFNYQDGPTYRCLYPTFPSANEVPDCNTAGVLGVVPGIIGTYQALEAIKVITGIGKIASGYLRIFDFLNNDFYEVKLKVRQENKQIDNLQESYEVAACVSVPTLTPDQLHKWITSAKEFVLADVREQEEYDLGHLDSSILTPLSVLDVGYFSHLKKPIVLLCQKGGRSSKAAEALIHSDATIEVYSVAGGIDEWQRVLGKELVIQ